MRTEIDSYETWIDTFGILLHGTPWGNNFRLWVSVDVAAQTITNRADMIEGAADYPLDDDQWAWVQANKTPIIAAVAEWFDANVG